MKPSVVIVSNRLPVSVKKIDGKLEFYPSVGGLATGLSSYVKDKRNQWIGWPGIASEQITEKERQIITDEMLKHNCYPVFLKQKQLDDYYNGFANTILWPLFHDLPADLDEHDKFWKAYKTVNAAFAEAVLALSESNSTVWVHDYQLLLLSALLRTARPDARIGFFLHIPFPEPAHFAKLPSAKALLEGMLGSDLVGLHTKAYVDNFLKVTTDLSTHVTGPEQVILGDRVVHVTDFPMGIDYDRFTRARDLAAVKSEVRKHRQKYKGLKVILTVDRLDPTKGLVERLQAYYDFLKQSPQMLGKVVMVMLAVPSRTEIEEYKKLRGRVEGLVKKINKEFGKTGWQPVDYMFTTLPVESVTALYQVADVAFITPIRDGMNLVAKEFIASKPKNNGVLILSETAGAAQELTNALLVNPRRRSTMVEALEDALTMPPRELKRRIAAMNEHISTHTVQDWAKTFMRTLQRPISGTPHIARSLTRDRQQDIIDSFHAARRRVLLLDYDGVLAPFAKKPSAAKPTETLEKLLTRLEASHKTDMAIISGRSKYDLENWFGNSPMTLIAEHGAVIRKAGHKKWQKTVPAPGQWQNEVELLFEKYAARTPGAIVEMKDFSAVWHYRGASPYYAQKNLVVLKRSLTRLAKAYDLEVNNGSKILEVRPQGLDKGRAALDFIESQGGHPDFILAIGDDYTDEDMFKVLPVSAYTIKVGRGTTAARYRLPSVDDVHALLRRLGR